MLSIYFAGLLLSFSAITFAQNTPETAQSTTKQLLSSEQIMKLEKQIEQWTTEYLESMTPQQLQIMANIAYFLFANTVCDLYTRTYLPAFVLYVQKAEKKVQKYDNATQEFSLLKAIIDKLVVMSNNRATMAQTLQKADDYIKKNPQNELLQSIIPALQSLRANNQQLLRMYADNVTQEFNDYMTTTAENLNNVTQLLHTAANMFKKPQELSNMVPNVPPHNQKLAKIEIASKVAQEIGAGGWENIAIAQNTMQYLTQLLCVAQITYGSYYQVVYNYMKTKNGNTKYHLQLFNEKGLIPAEYRTTPLPAPEEVAQ